MKKLARSWNKGLKVRSQDRDPKRDLKRDSGHPERRATSQHTSVSWASLAPSSPLFPFCSRFFLGFFVLSSSSSFPDGNGHQVLRSLEKNSLKSPKTVSGKVSWTGGEGLFVFCYCFWRIALVLKDSGNRSSGRIKRSLEMLVRDPLLLRKFMFVFFWGVSALFLNELWGLREGLVVVSLAVVAVKIGRAKEKRRTASFFSFVLSRNLEEGLWSWPNFGGSLFSCVEIPLLFWK